MAETIDQTLRGSFGTVWLDGTEIGILESIEYSVAIDYEDMQVGFDKDRREKSQSGSGKLSYKPTNSNVTKLYKDFTSLKGKRFVVEANLADPSAEGGGEEGYQLNGVTFDEYPLINWTPGEVISKELSFSAPPSKMIILDEIVG
jgi:hypothetical protein